MATLDTYRTIIKRIIQNYAQIKPALGDIQTQAILDEERGHYVLMNVGWNQAQRIYFPAIHIDVIDDKVWLQCDNTSAVIADELIAAGIPPEHIILGFRHPDVRAHTGMGIN